MSKIEQVVNFFRNHPRFPFLNWNTNYDDYCAMFLCLTNILKCYIPKETYLDSSYAYGYMEFRGNPDGIVAFPLTCEPYRVCRRVNILRDYSDDKIKIYP